MIKGTDLSRWNVQVNYDQMVDAGIRFGCLKLGQGRLPKDALADTHRTAFMQRNLPYDWYWFCDYRQSGADNAQCMVKKADGDFGAGHPVMDLEFYDGFGARPPGHKMRQFALDFLGTFEALTGLICMIYTNRDMIKQIMAGITAEDKARFLRHELWLATAAAYGNPAPWPKYRLNQYELDIIVPWSKSTVDLNEFNGTEAEFAIFYGKGATPPAALTLEEKVKVIELEARKKGWQLWKV